MSESAPLCFTPDVEIFDLRGPILRQRDFAAGADRPTDIGRRRTENRSGTRQGYVVRGMGEDDAAGAVEQHSIDGIAKAASDRGDPGCSAPSWSGPGATSARHGYQIRRDNAGIA
jgi:hypothetical protein